MPTRPRRPSGRSRGCTPAPISPTIRPGAGPRSSVQWFPSSRDGRGSGRYCRLVPTAKIDGLTIAYEIHGEGRPWVITPGGRFSKDYRGVRELAVALADRGNRVLIW